MGHLGQVGRHPCPTMSHPLVGKTHPEHRVPGPTITSHRTVTLPEGSDNLPEGSDNVPYFDALVASSCSARLMV